MNVLEALIILSHYQDRYERGELVGEVVAKVIVAKQVVAGTAEDIVAGKPARAVAVRVSPK